MLVAKICEVRLWHGVSGAPHQPADVVQAQVEE